MGYNLFGSIEESMVMLWADVMSFLPQLVVAILVLILGWIIAALVGKLVRKFLAAVYLDSALDKAGVGKLTEKAGFDFKPSNFVGALVKWFIIIAFAMVAFDILGLMAVTSFVREVVLEYLPHVFAAAFILFAAMLVAGVAKNALAGALRAGGSSQADFLGRIAYYLVITFGILAALNQLQIAEELVQTLFTGVVFALALGFGLAFGLGGKNAAGQTIEELTNKR